MWSRFLLLVAAMALLQPATLLHATALRPCTLERATARRLHLAQRFPQQQLRASEAADADEPAEAEATEAEEKSPEKSPVQLEREALQAQISQLESQLFSSRGDLAQAQDNLKDAGESGYMLTAADFERYRLQCRSELESQAGYGRSNAMRPLLGFVEEFDQLQQVAAASASEDEKPIHDFYAGIYKQLTSLLAENAVSRFDVAIGDAYDYKKHNDVERVASDSVPINCVVSVSAGGWMMGDEALERAKVQISSGPTKQPAAAADGPDTTQEEQAAQGEME